MTNNECLLCHDAIEQEHGICKDCYDALPHTKALKEEVEKLRGIIKKLKEGLEKAIYYAKPPICEIIDYKILEKYLPSNEGGKKEAYKR